MLIGLVFAVVAMVLNSVAGLLQSEATNHTGRRPLLVRPRYLTGLLSDVLGWVCTVVALRHLPVFAVQAILGGTIALTAMISRWTRGTLLAPPDRLAVAACMFGLVLVAASAGGESPRGVGLGADLVLVGALVALIGVSLGLRKVAAAWPFALVAGLGFGGTSLAVRAVHLRNGAGFDLAALLAEPAAYLVIGFGAVGVISYSRALGRGGLASVTAVLIITEVIVPGLVGIALLGDQVRPGWAWVFAVGLLLAASGVLRLARSPGARGRASWPVRRADQDRGRAAGADLITRPARPLGSSGAGIGEPEQPRG